MKIQWKKLIVCVLIPLAVGGLSGFLSRAGTETFRSLNQPPLSPPGWLFPVVWSILYVLMGIASYLVLTSEHPAGNALTAYTVQLIFNFFWPLIFFNLQQYLLAFVFLVVLWGLIAATIVLFGKSSKTAAYLMIPYLLWVTFAGYLNLGIYLLNK